jgi:hypothetical protein
MVLESVVPMSSSLEPFNGELYIYRFTDPSPHPEKILTTRINLVGDTFDLRF